MSLPSPAITDQIVGHANRDDIAPPENAAVLLAHSVLEELFRRRAAIGFLAVLLLCLLAAAVGFQVWGIEASASTALDTPNFSVSTASSDPVDGGPSGTWQRWGDLGSQKRSQSPVVSPSGTSTTTFSETGAVPRSPVASATTTTTQPGSS